MNIISILLAITMSLSSFGALDYDHGASMSYNDLVHAAYDLEDTYPELIQVQVIGQSTQGLDILSITLSKGGLKYISLDAGIHAREYVTSFILLETLEMYCQELTIPGSYSLDYDIHELIKDVSISTILTVNPDGIDLALEDPTWKANINGVDLNRNFDSKYFANDKLHDIWGWDGISEKTWAYSSEPNYAYFSGYNPDSEIEIQVAKEFYKTKDFRLFMTMHTRGQIIYFDRPNMPTQYQEDARRIAYGVYNINGYEPQVADEDSYISSIRDGGSGTTTDYLSGEYEKPAFTIELMEAESIQPAPQETWNAALEEFKNIPVYLMYEANQMTYGNHKVYIDGAYYCDYTDLSFAQEIARLRSGEVLSYEGDPYTNSLVYNLQKTNHLSIAEKLNDLNIISGDSKGNLLIEDSLNRAQLATLLARLNNSQVQASEFKDNMGFSDVSATDWYSPYVNYAKAQGWMNGISDTEFDPLGLVSEEMIAITLLRVLGYSTDWGQGIPSLNGLGVFSLTSDSKEVSRGEVFDYIYKTLHCQPNDSEVLLKDRLGFKTDHFDSFYAYGLDENNHIHFFDQELNEIDYNGTPIEDYDIYKNSLYEIFNDSISFSQNTNNSYLSREQSLDLYNKQVLSWIIDQTTFDENILFQTGTSIRYNRDNIPYFYNTSNRVMKNLSGYTKTYLHSLEAISTYNDDECHVYNLDGLLLKQFEGYEMVTNAFGQYVSAYKDGVTYILDSQGKVINSYDQKIFFVLNR